MRLLRHRVLPLLAFFCLTAPISGADLESHLREALASGQTEATMAIGFPFGKTPFRDVPSRAGLLIGLDVALLTQGKPQITGIRGVYRTSTGEVTGREQGQFNATPQRPGQPK